MPLPPLIANPNSKGQGLGLQIKIENVNKYEDHVSAEKRSQG